MIKIQDRFWLQPTLEKEGSKVLCRLGLVKALADKIGPTVFVARQISVGQSLEEGSLLYVVESTKAAMDIESPLALQVRSVNLQVEREPELVFQDPEGLGWLLEGWIEDVFL